jgi:hypothetical protein
MTLCKVRYPVQYSSRCKFVFLILMQSWDVMYGFVDMSLTFEHVIFVLTDGVLMD